MSDDFPANTGTTALFFVDGDPVAGNIETAGDHDWFQTWLWAGHTYVFQERGFPSGVGTLNDPLLALHNNLGGLLASNDDGGPFHESYLRFVAPSSASYYVDAGAFSSGTGTYKISVTEQADTLATANQWGTGTTTSDRLADFTGDGKDDLLQISANGTVYEANSSPNGFGFESFQVVGSGATPNDQIGIFRADFNVGGPADLLQLYHGTAYVASWNDMGRHFDSFSPWLTGGVLADARHADVNFDRQQDLVQITSDGKVQVALSTGSAFQPFVTSNIGATPNDQISSGHNFADQPDVTRSDFNGDGRADLLQLYNGRAYVALAAGPSGTPGQFGAYTQWSDGGGSSSDRFGDFNGDGKADLMQISNGTAYVAFSNGFSFGPWQQWVTGASPSDQITDMNGDNRADLYQVFNNFAYVALTDGNNGHNFVGSEPFHIWAQGVTAADRLGDVNGDGLTDVVHVDDTAATVFQSLHVPGGDQHLFIV